MIGKCICGIVAGILVAVGITLSVYFFVFAKVLPKAQVQYEVTDASMSKFNLSADGNFLDYNLTLSLKLENPSGFDYKFDHLAVVPVLKDQNLTGVPYPSKSFYLGHESNVTFPALFWGSRSVAFGEQEALNLRNASVFDVVLKIYSQYWTKAKKNDVTINQDVACYLKNVPLNSNGTSSGRFQITKCDGTKFEYDDPK